MKKINAIIYRRVKNKNSVFLNGNLLPSAMQFDRRSSAKTLRLHYIFLLWCTLQNEYNIVEDQLRSENSRLHKIMSNDDTQATSVSLSIYYIIYYYLNNNVGIPCFVFRSIRISDIFIKRVHKTIIYIGIYRNITKSKLKFK